MKLASCKSALNLPPTLVIYSTDCSKAVVPVLVLLFVALWFILRGVFIYVLPCAILFWCLSVLLALRLPCLEKRELILVCFVRLLDLHSWCLGRTAVCDCGTPWTFLLPFFFFFFFFFKVSLNIQDGGAFDNGFKILKLF